MTFTPEQTAALAADLDRSNVAQREQAGRKLSYIEAWHAIAEANRIFGFDGWNRQTVELVLLGEPRMVGDKARVGYRAKVRITVGDVVREGCGFGSGIDKDVDQAHESALKEAESDAMKRALMTFGNPFGLALYDKSQSSVSDAPAAPSMEDRAISHLKSCAIDRAVFKEAWEKNKDGWKKTLDGPAYARVVMVMQNLASTFASEAPAPPPPADDFGLKGDDVPRFN